ncbi:MAG TPA: hypothetical protein VGY30_03525 [Solirubrobacteraceae bacterium]|nr:hypothetical protein [Solirubrobacteraceae bacterium]
MPRALFAAAILTVIAVGMAALAMVDSGVLCVLPALVLCVPLLFRRYPGECLLAGWGRRAGSAPRRPSSARCRGRSPAHRFPRGGLLIARHLAVRPPPAPLAAS